MPEVKLLDQNLVNEYAQLVADISGLEERKKVIRETLVAGFQKGFKCPTSGPYLLSMVVQQRSSLSWKEEWMTLAKEQLGKFWKKRLKQIQSEAEVVPTPTILPPKVNPDYKIPEMRKAS